MFTLSFNRPVGPPNSSHALLCHPRFYAKAYEKFDEKRKQRDFRIRDSSLASLFRMYEMLLCGLGKELGQETEYFVSQKWRVEEIPEPTRLGWEHDLERERVFQALAIILFDALNYQIISGESTAGVGLHSVPKWAKPLLNHIEIEDLYGCYPALAHIYFYLPWRSLSFIHPLRCPRTIVEYANRLASEYRHRDKLVSLPLFAETDNILTSLCRAYELCVLKDVVPEMVDAFEEEVNYLMNRWGSSGFTNIPDPRTRWEKMDVKEPAAHRGLVQFTKMMAERAPVKAIPSWAIDFC